MLSVNLSNISTGGGIVFSFSNAEGPISLYRTDPTTSQTYTLLNAVPNIGIYIDMGDKSPQVLQNNVPYQYSVSDGVTTLSFTVTLPPNPVAEATYENLLYSLSRIIEAAIQTIPFPTSPTGTPDPLTNKAIVYMTLPMTENIKTPAIFVNQELLKMDDFPVGGLTETYREFYSGTPSLFTRVFSITILDVNAVTCNFYHDLIVATIFAAMHDILGDAELQQSIHIEIKSTGGPKLDGGLIPSFYMTQILLTLKGPLSLLLSYTPDNFTNSIQISINGGQVYTLSGENIISNLTVSSSI